MKIKIKRKNKRSGGRSAGARTQQRGARRVPRPATIPYTFWKQWSKARQRGEYDLLFAMAEEEGPFRKQFEDFEDFSKKAKLNPLPLGPGWRLEKIKLDEQKAYLLSSRGIDDPGIKMADLELMELRKTVAGWRLFDVSSVRKRKERGTELFVSFGDFDIASADHDLHLRIQEGFERPDLADHKEESDADAPDDIDPSSVNLGNIVETSASSDVISSTLSETVAEIEVSADTSVASSAEGVEVSSEG